MKRMQGISRLVIALSVISSLTLVGCGGGGGGGGGNSDGAATLVSIVASISSSGNSTLVPLWTGTGTSGTTPTNTPGPVYLNAAIIFTFGGAVSPASLPQGGLATGSINISTSDGMTTTPASGSFSVEDDPTLPPGNMRRVVFLPTPPTDPAAPAQTAGFAGATTYTVFVPRADQGTQVVGVAGGGLSTEALASFYTCDPLGPSGSLGCFTDPTDGPPYIVSTTPDTFDPAPLSIDPSTVVNNTISMFFSEPLFPQNIDLANIQLINSFSGAQTPGSLQFYQAGTPEAGPAGSRIDYIASSTLLSSVTYQIVISNLVTDFGNNPVSMYDPDDPAAPASGQRLFETDVVPFCPQPSVDEDFTSTANRDIVTGAAVWDGSGQVVSQFPFELVGDGAFGPMAFAAGPSTLDTGLPASAGFSDGNYDAASLDVMPGAAVRVVGPFRLHVRCLGDVTIDGSLNASAGTNPGAAAAGTPEQGPQAGASMNTAASPTVRGGVGGPGGGDGGRASQEGNAVRTNNGEAGTGATVAGMLNMGPFGSNPHFGAGPGGQGGFRWPAGGVSGELGGLGAAGGSSWAQAGNGEPFSNQLQGCMAYVPMVQSTADATPATPGMMIPFTTASAGSGGGGGGDRWHLAGIASDPQGGGGGGGGGGVRISAIGTITLGTSSVVNCLGANGASGSLLFAGGGGGGGGGQIWFQSFTDIVIASAAQLRVLPGNGASMCSDHASGAGGNGAYQFEDPDGMVNTNFVPAGGGTGGANISVIPFPFSSTITGIAQREWFDTGYGDPDYDPSTIVTMTSLGANPAPGSAIFVEFQGAFETLTTGQPDLTTLSSWVEAPAIDQLDGRRFLRWRVRITFDAPNSMGTGTTPTNTLPSAQFVGFGYSIPC